MNKNEKLFEKFIKEYVELGYDGGFEDCENFKEDLEYELEVWKDVEDYESLVELIKKYLEELK